MRRFITSIVLLGCLTAPALAALPPAYRSSPAYKPESAGRPRALAPSAVPGGGFATPIVIPSLPFSDAQNTCSFLNNVQGTCGGTGPDVVYAYTPAQNTCVTISLCDPATNFDTVLNLYLNSSTNLVTCSDDVCALQSQISNVTLFAGNTYYIVVDGFGGECGNYQLQITPCATTCNVACPVGAFPEGEALCSDGGTDSYNAGCNSTPMSWVDVPCRATPVTFCGRYGNFTTGNLLLRDTDWYRVVLGQPSTLVATVDGELPSAIAIVDVSAGCAGLVERCPIQLTAPCTPLTCSATVPAGTYFVFVAPADFAGNPCSARYTLTVSSSDCITATTSSSWGRLKAMYR